MVVKVNIFVGILQVCFLLSLSCASPRGAEEPARPPRKIPVPAPEETVEPSIRVGAERLAVYLPMLEGKRVGIIANHSSLVQGIHLVDTLQALGITIQRIFSPEHGFRGLADNGALIGDTIDTRSGLPVISLYGKHKKPYPEELADMDVLLFDLQDVGARFYTYISTMHYAMEAAAEEEKTFIVLDRPNPNGHFVDGPLLQAEQRSFVGLHPVPVVHGMTVGEYARMVNEEGWLADSVRAELYVIPCQFYDHSKPYELAVRPSPNLPNMRSIYLYPSLCFFEGTEVSVGRGTEIPFQCYGAPNSKFGDYTFTPLPKTGASQPKHEGLSCRGFDLSGLSADSIRQIGQLQLKPLLDFYEAYPDKASFFLKNRFFDLLAGTRQLREQIEQGLTEAAIRKSWEADLKAFKAIRAKYLMYKE